MAQQSEWINSKGLCDVEELNHVQPTFTALKLRDVGLGPFQPARENGLRKTSVLSGFDQKLAKTRIGWREDGLCQTMSYPRAGTCSHSLKPNLG
jgi:hypothetical protein